MTSANFDFILRHMNKAAVDGFSIGFSQNVVHFIRRLLRSSASVRCHTLYVPHFEATVDVEDDIIGGIIGALRPQKYEADLSSLGAAAAGLKVLMPMSLRTIVNRVSIHVRFSELRC